MSGWGEVFLGIIAFATLATAIVQIGVLVAAGLLARRVQRLTVKVEQDLQPFVQHLNAIGEDASRAASLAVAQVERADLLFSNLADRVEQTVDTVQHTIAAPARKSAAVFHGIKAALSVIRGSRRRSRRSRSGAEDEDALFI